MSFIDKHTPLSQVLFDHYQVIPVINRFGIQLGVGDDTIEEVALKHQLDLDFLIVIFNTYIDEDYFPEKKLKNFDVQLVLDYLQKTDEYILHGQLYNLQKHLNAFISISDSENKQLTLLAKLFERFKEALTSEIEKGMMDSDYPLELLIDLKTIIIKHLSGNYNINMCYAVVFSIDSLIKDLEQNDRIRKKVLQPMLKNLEEMGIISDWKDLIDPNLMHKHEEKAMLSPREIDVLKLVAKGHMNKEVADELNISVNTVLTHRKNIMSKLEIKTVSGLIFYCIHNGLISSDEVEL